MQLTVKELRLGRGNHSEKEENLVLTFKRTALVEIGPQSMIWKKETSIKICDNLKSCSRNTCFSIKTLSPEIATAEILKNGEAESEDGLSQ